MSCVKNVKKMSKYQKDVKISKRGQIVKKMSNVKSQIAGLRREAG